MNELLEAHKHSSNNSKEISDSNMCGCFHCENIFSPQEITEWIDERKTAICPICGIDSVIGSASLYPITFTFLSKMRNFWFYDSGLMS